jgi:hypothetical protein
MMRKVKAINRRTLLRGVGGVALATPFLSSLREARGQDPTPPRRLVIFYTHNGCITDRWWPALEDGALAADTFDGTTLEVLGPHHRKLLMPRGFRSMNPYVVGQSIDPHDQAMGSKLTCARLSDDRSRYPVAESLDHTIAKQINPGGVSPLVLSVGAPSTSIKEVLSFSAPNTAFPAIVNPQTVYSSLAGALRPVPGTTPAAGTGTTTGVSVRGKLGPSVIDLVRDDLLRFQQLKMSQTDQKRIQHWLDLLRDTEVSLSPPACSAELAAELGVTAEAVSALDPANPPEVSGPITSSEIDLATAFTRGGDMMMNLMALSMVCDTNRSLILTYPGYVKFSWDGIEHAHDHAGLSHRSGDLSSGLCGVENVLALLGQIDRWYAGKFARLVGLLDSIEEGSGTLLDNTATLWLPEFSDGGAHNLNNLPILIAGSAGGYLKQGQAVNVEGTPIGRGNSSRGCADGSTGMPTGNTGSTGGNVPINKLYVTLMNAVGCTQDGSPGGDPVTHFGEFDGMGVESGITNPGEVAALVAG